VRSGCFFGNEYEFKQIVRETHNGNKFEKQYFLSLELAKLTFNE